MCDCTFAFRTWIPNTSILTFALIKQDISAISVSDVWMYICLTFGFKDLNSQHIYYDFCFDQIRNLGHISVRCGCTFAWHLAFKTWMPNTSILTFATATTKQKYRVFSLLYTEALAVARWIFISCAFKSSCQMEPFATHRAR